MPVDSELLLIHRKDVTALDLSLLYVAAIDASVFAHLLVQLYVSQVLFSGFSFRFCTYGFAIVMRVVNVFGVGDFF